MDGDKPRMRTRDEVERELARIQSANYNAREESRCGGHRMHTHFRHLCEWVLCEDEERAPVSVVAYGVHMGDEWGRDGLLQRREEDRRQEGETADQVAGKGFHTIVVDDVETGGEKFEHCKAEGDVEGESRG